MERVEVNVGKEDPIIIETGELALFASGSVVVKQGGTAVLATVCLGETPSAALDFTPLTVDYREQSSAWGKIPGGFIKREGKPTDREILVSRVIDRTLRPLFPEGFNYEVVVTVLTLSADEKYDPDVLSIIGGGAALTISPIPFHGPCGALRIGLVDGTFVPNPTYEERQRSELDLIVSFREGSVIMVEGGGKEVPEDKVVSAIFYALKVGEPLILAQKELAQRLNRKKLEELIKPFDEVFYKRLKELSEKKVELALSIPDKLERRKALQEVFEEVSQSIEPELQVLSQYYFKKLVSETMRRKLFETGLRIDGRRPEDIREIKINLHPFERPHGSAIFSRGQTQVYATVTLGSREEAQLVETIFEGETFKRFMLHYNFPPFCTGDARPWGPPRRREIGHGALAERAIEPFIPPEEEFPYIIRVVANVLSSNGSSSMATVCASSLALFDAGVPLPKHVAGVAMGLVRQDERNIILTDILGDEDQLGDMDFKVAGTYDGITSLQMDLKVKGITEEILISALERAKLARFVILDKMYSACPKPRPELSPYAPLIEIVQVPEEKAPLIIGPGGKTVKEIRERTNTVIWVLEGGKVSITGKRREDLEAAKREIFALLAEVEVGKTYTGKIVRIEPYGLFVEILPGRVGLLHVSKMESPPRDLRSNFKIGDEIKVRVFEIDELGRPRLTTFDLDKYEGPVY
ncbi:MAG: polyribonucleotide nucleotidyltransferase [Thermodesulfobacteriaceae bacterium]|jgi:polyribonucleotide nucleotidyltransferase